MKLKNLLLIITLSILIISCVTKYEIEIIEVTFDHNGTTDLINYKVINPTIHELTCDMKIEFEGTPTIQTNFKIKPNETQNLTTEATIPTGDTNIKFISNCEPIIE